MKSNRVADIVINKKSLKVGIPRIVLVKLMEQLPENSSVVDIFDNFAEGISLIRVQSSGFKEVEPTNQVPEIFAKVTETPADPLSGLTTPQYEVEIDWSPVEEQNKLVLRNGSQLTLPQGFELDPIVLPRDFDLPEDDEEVVDKCDHKWISWINSFSNQKEFDYCEKCGVRKDES